MKINTDHPSFISFLGNVSNNILSAIKTEEYFTLTSKQKMAVSYTVLNLIKNSARIRAAISDSELKSFIVVLCKKNEENENYEFAAILNDIVTNYDMINNLSDSTKKPVKKSKPIKSNSPE